MENLEQENNFEQYTEVTKTIRFINYLIDNIVIMLIAFIVFTCVGLVSPTTLENAASADDILYRSLYRLVPFNMLSFIGSDSIGWHDKWSKTTVVYDKN